MMRLHLDQALALALALDETLLVALITEASEYCEAHGFGALTTGIPSSSLQ
ncbi:hypothetical protein ACU5AX_12930 [Sphingomonas sp. XXL09]|uniref:hypothetical protein n=1 Tax=Sphingomonas sp. XXL09 TaxID=3457787 RepID=UPI00406BCE03